MARLMWALAPLLGNYVLPYYLAQFQKKHPDVTLQLSIANTEQVIQELNQLNIDIGIIEGNCHSDAITKSYLEGG